jgi:hypothetical protein
MRTPESVAALTKAGISYDDATHLRRISMQLHRWHELECGDQYGCVGRDETTGKTYWLNAMTNHRSPFPDRETSALKRLAKVMKRYPTMRAFVQGDPRGCALYILRPGDVPEGQPDDAYYNRGIAVYK